MIEQRDRPIGVALAQRHLGPERLRERLECHPALISHQRERVLEHLDRLGQLPAQQQRAAQDRQRPRRLPDVAAAPRGRDRLPEQTDRCLVVGPVRQRLAAYAEHGRALPVVRRQRDGASQPPAGRHSAARLRRHEAELAADLALDLTVAAGFGERERLVQHRRALLVTAANRMHQLSPKRRERCAPAAPGHQQPAPLHTPAADTPHRARPRRQPRPRALHRAAPRRPPDRRRRQTLRAILVGRAAHPRIGRAPQLAAEQQLARIGVVARGANLSGPRQAPHQQLVSAVVEPVERERSRR